MGRISNSDGAGGWRWALRALAFALILSISVSPQMLGRAAGSDDPVAPAGPLPARAALPAEAHATHADDGLPRSERMTVDQSLNASSSGSASIIAPQPPRIECQPGPAEQYRSCVYHDALGLSLTFYLYLPRDYDPGRRYPLVLLLHGGGERADLNRSDARNRDALVQDPYAEVWGPGYAGSRPTDVQSRWPSFIVAPQLVYPNRWVDIVPGAGSHTMDAQPTYSLRMAKEIVDHLVEQYQSIDTSRLYVTGMSLGGYGTWEMIERWPHYFAAAAPICGAGDPGKAAAIARLPIWAFHGANDPIVPVSGSRDMIAAMRAAGGAPRYTEYPGVGHGSWTYAYSIDDRPSPTPDFFAWLFAQRRGSATGDNLGPGTD